MKEETISQIDKLNIEKDCNNRLKGKIEETIKGNKASNKFLIFIKNIITVSYIKNKGIKRLCFIAGVIFSTYTSFIVSTNIYSHRVDEQYNNLTNFCDILDAMPKYDSVRWLDLKECFSQRYFSHRYNLGDFPVCYLNSDNCEIYDGDPDWVKECKVVKKLGNKPIILSCSGFETLHYTKEGLFMCFVFVIFSFYIAFIFAVLTKLLLKLLKWIYDGFKEANKNV
jgi:hypothetical protein